jgi:hypothetical protein
VKHRTVLAVALTAFSACVTATIHHLSPTVYPPVEVIDVTTFMSPDELLADSIAYERIAMIFTKGSSAFTDGGAHFKTAREEAARIGANGLVVQSAEQGGRYNWFWGSSTPRESSVMAIRWWVVPGGQREGATGHIANSVARVVVLPSLRTLSVGEEVQLGATAIGTQGETVQTMFRWSSSNDAIASVNSGLVTAHADGEVVIAANADNVVGTATIVVQRN